jgi:hypothetical protein
MLNFNGGINKNYGWELGIGNICRRIKDGVNIIEFQINWDRYEGNHSPRFEIYFTIFNCKIIEFSIYYLHHRNNVLDKCNFL